MKKAMKKLGTLAFITMIGFVPASLFAGDAKMVGNAEKGKTLSESCAACHGADGNSTNPEWPKLAGQHESYLIKQLMDYRGDKRKHAVMTGMAKAIKSDEDVLHIAAYYASVAAKGGKASSQELADQGKAIYLGGVVESGVAACSACHGPTGSGNPSAKFPKVSGQHSTYGNAQLAAFKEGIRANDNGKMMRNVVKKMTKAEMKAVSDYMAGLRD